MWIGEFLVPTCDCGHAMPSSSHHADADDRAGAGTSSAAPIRVCAILVLAIDPGLLGALQSQRFEDCHSHCSISIRRIAVLGEEDGPGYVGLPSSILRRSDGAFVVAENSDQGRVKIFERDGFFMRSLGREGQGPGEFRSARFLYPLPEDSLEVYDLQNQRLTVFTPDFEVARTVPYPVFATASVRFGDGSRVIASQFADPNTVGLPLQMVTPEGERIRAFGADPPVEQFREFMLIARSLTRASDSSVWSGEKVRYRIQEWSINGRLLREIDRESEWFSPHSDFRPSPQKEPSPRLAAIWYDGQDLLWTMVHVADEEWQEGTGEDFDRLRGERRLTITDMESYWDTMIEVLDLTDGRVVRSQRHEAWFLGFTPDGLGYSYSQGGGPQIAIWSFDPNLRR